MIPFLQHIGLYSPSSKECAPSPLNGKNGFHKQPDKTEEDSPCSNNSLLCSFKFVSNVSKEQQSKFCNEGENLIKILEKDPKNLEAVSKFVESWKDISVTWKNSEYSLQLCDLSGTDYMGQEYMQEAWEELYPQNSTRMQVFGNLKCSQPSLTSIPWVILVGEDGCIYAYGDEELQLIAKSLQEFVEHGKKKIYELNYYPECSDEDEESLKQDEVVQQIRQRGKDFVNNSEKQFDDFMNYFDSI